MAAPTSPTLVSIVTEALKKAGWANPTTDTKAPYTRARDEWMGEIKNDIWTITKKLKSLQTKDILTTTNGRVQYSMPTDYSSDLLGQVMEGSVYGTATGGASKSITLAAADTSGSDIIGKEILIYAGTGINQTSYITAFNTTTKVATVSPDWSVTPVSGDSYMLIDTYYPLLPTHLWVSEGIQHSALRDRPSHYNILGNATTGDMLLYPSPYRTSAIPYGIKRRYYANLMTLDLAGTLMSTLYQNWRNVFVQGLFYKALVDMDDTRQDAAKQTYNKYLTSLVAREEYGKDIEHQHCIITDY